MIPEEDIEIFQTAIDELRAQGLDEDMVTEQIVIALAVKYDESENQLDLDPKFIDDALAQLGLSLGGSSDDDDDDDDDDEVEYDEELKKYPPSTYLLIDGASVLEELDDDTVKKAISEGGARGFEHFTSGLQQVIQITSQDPLEYRVVAQGPDYDDDDDDDEPAPEQPPMMTQEVIDDETILSILGSAELLKLIRSKDSPFDIEIADRLDAKGVTLLYDNQRASRIIRTIEGVDNGNPIYGMPLSEEANVIFPVPGSNATVASIIERQIEPDMRDNRRKTTVQDGLDKLSRVQDAISNLSDVFGFDDPAELEAFFAAWLMKNSTCRLSGIPGTGKTTVINSAAIIMANSYGFSEAARFYPRSIPGARAPDLDRARFYFPNGMTYDVSYSARGLVETLSAWDEWRFSDWSEVQYARDGTPLPAFSGAYTYGFEFLRPQASKMQINAITADGTTVDLGSHTKTVDLSSDEFARLLYMHITPSNSIVEEMSRNQSARDVSDFINTQSRPIQIEANADGSITIVDGPRENESFSVPGGGSTIVNLLAPIGKDLYRFQEALRTAGHRGIVFSTDMGANEGYYLRQALMRYTYDSRSKLNNRGDFDSSSMESLRSEMLREIGIAKIDNDKRADEILYGMEIQQVSETREGKEVNTFVFDPIPRPIVTQPIKFFNEANRSQAGVEDAVLGLIAEKEVEYRGKTFNSPSFVAWMDTNPHQKANDLAFTDRIDTELFFGTISLGQRNAQLQSRYAGASNAKPDIQLVTRIIESSIEHPLRISDLGLGSDSIWRFVDNIPFRPPDVTTGYDGLRDIATLSVLFTQRPQLRTAQNANNRISYEIGGATYVASDNRNPHASPLEDISRSSIADIIAGQMVTAANIYGEGADTFQPQTNIKRVLGFRFTDSIVKMSRALAFLRGKEYVGRQEIVDALPYCLGHRIGRARGEGGNDSTGVVEISTPSEQEYVRQVIVHGYLMDRVDDTGNTITGTFRTWDSFFNYCEQMLASAANYREFENSVLRNLRESFLGGGNNLTTVHWHLATSVVEREREGITNMHPSHYSMICSDDPEGDYNYPDVLAYYRKLISRPEKNGASTIVAMGYNFSAADYYKARGLIASDPFLFSDDKAHLLGLIDSRIEQLCGADSELGSVSNVLAVDGDQPYMDDEIIHGDDPRLFPWRTYGDSGGAWGSVLGVAGDSGLLGNAGLPYGWSPGGPDDTANLASMSDQAHRIIFRCATKANNSESDDSRKRRSEQERRLRDHQIPSLKRKIGPLCHSGVLFTLNGGLPGTPGASAPTDADSAVVNASFPSEITNILDDTAAGTPVRFESFMSMVDELIKVRMSGANDDRNQAKALLAGSGIMACFELDHGRGIVAAASRSRGDVAAFLRDLGTDLASSLGRLRLWVRLHSVANNDDNFVLTFGITSCPATTGEMTQKDEDGNDVTVVTSNYATIDDKMTYIRTAYTSPPDDEGRLFYDSGNLTRDDLVFYDRLFSQAFNSRSGEE